MAPKKTTLGAALVAAAALMAGTAEARVGCRDMDGNPVDWFAAYKIPQVDSGPTWYAQGLGFAYMDANSGGQLKEMPKDLTSTTQALSYTLNQIYSNAGSSSIAYVMYNDETPSEKENSANGHTKGEVAYDSETGFWLIHSVPRWPNPAAQGYDFPDRETRYGQSFLCLSLRSADFEKVARQFQFTYPQVYDSNIPASLAASSTLMQSVINREHEKGAPYTNVQPLTTLAGAQFTSFAKNGAWDSDMYEDLLAPQLQDNLRVESWQNGRGKMSSYCRPAKPYNVENVVEVELSAQAQWTSTKDHSKIALSSPATGFVCIGDGNRQVAQAKRGWQTTCSNNPALYAAYNAIMEKLESCD